MLLSAAGARAEEAPPLLEREAPGPASTWSQEPLETEPEAELESPELRMLRLAEEELFGASQASADGATPRDAITSAPPASFERGGEVIDLSFLQGLKLPSTPVHWDSRVIEYLLFFKDDPRGRELAAGWLKRRERFGPMVRKILAEHSLPEDLQYVAMIESGYDPLAHSAAEAWGMWQFIKQPAQYYGLRVDHWSDERLDPERATRAAARFLRDLHDRFGSWELAFASYNMGYGGLLRAIKKYNTNDYWLLSHLEAGLPFETSLYVAKISAMAIVANNPERFGFDKPGADTTRQLARVDVAPGSKLEAIASAAGLTLEQLRAVNPHILQSRVPPGEPAVQVYVPREAQVRFAQHWSTQREPTPLPYVVRLGETLELVAKRTGTTAQQLRELNELASDASVKAGFALFVPSHAKPTADLVEPLVCSVPARTFDYTDKKRVFYRVGADDTTAEVARFFDVTQADLLSWNSVAEGAALHAGMLLQVFVKPEQDLSQAVVYTPDEVRVLTVGSNEFFDYHESQRDRVRVRYRVQKNDTISSLAARFDLSAGSIGRINQFPSNRELRAGERITLYAPSEDVAELERKELAERFAQETDERVIATARGQDDSEVELPESKGKLVVEPHQEMPLPPPKKKHVEAPSLPAPVLKNAKTVKPAPKSAAKKRE